jgi:hypothetical protein
MEDKRFINKKAGISYLEIFLLIASVFAFSFLVAIPQTEKVSAQAYADYCCEKTVDGTWCQNTNPDNCDTSNGLRKTPTSCEATSFCKPGCCYDSQEGLCMENTPQKVCQQNNGTWTDSAECDIPQCELGCCVLDNQAALVTLTRCKRLSGFYGLGVDFRNDIQDEMQCIALAQAQDRGACVFEENYVRTCKFTTRQECMNIESSGNMSEPEFHKDLLCSAEELGTNCAIPSIENIKTTCVQGKDEVYFIDTCGNIANIYDASKITNKAYWTEVIDKSESCNAGESNAGSESCGNCDYYRGSICRGYERGDSPQPDYGENICVDLNCYDTTDGEHRHGETWCDYDAIVGEGKDPVGARHFRHLCVAGEELVEPCADFRNGICIQGRIETTQGEFQEAACRTNRWKDCTLQTDKEDCENLDQRDCHWIEGISIAFSSRTESEPEIGGTSEEGSFVTGQAIFGGDDDDEDSGGEGAGLPEVVLSGGTCVPAVPPGLKFWEQGQASSICGKASAQCIVEFEEKILGGKDCVENCECLEESWAQEMNKICRSMGDCGGYVNYVGEFTDDGAEWIVDGQKKTLSKGIIDSISKGAEIDDEITGLTTLVLAVANAGSWLVGMSVVSGNVTNSPVPTDTSASMGKASANKLLENANKKVPPEIIPAAGAAGGGGDGGLFGLGDMWSSISQDTLLSSAFSGLLWGAAGALVGSFVGDGNAAEAAFFAGLAGGMSYNVLKEVFSKGKINVFGKELGGGWHMSELANVPVKGGEVAVENLANKFGGTDAAVKALEGEGYTVATEGGQITSVSEAAIANPGATAFWIGIGVAVVTFILLYKEESKEVVVFNCRPWQAPTGGENCEVCNQGIEPCSEYRCKSLGQACELLNAGTEEEKCAWINPHDTTSPTIEPWEQALSVGHEYVDVQQRPPGRGMRIIRTDSEDGCIKAFTPLEFGITTNEPAQCKIDYNHTKKFDDMTFYFGESNIYSYNHSQRLSLPGPDTINHSAPEIENDGTYTLYTRCRDGNDNYNVDEFAIRFCVDEGPDVTAPKIVDTSIGNNMPVKFNQTSLDLEVYVNEPAECRWSREDRTYDNMEYNMSCSTNVWEMNNDLVYTCTTTLTGIKDRQDNVFYFRCKDKPNAKEGDRNVNQQGYKYTVKGTQTLNIIDIAPNGTIKGSTDTVPVTLKVETANGYSNGNAICYYSTTGNENDYVQFYETDSNIHLQRQDLTQGNYEYFVKCIDLGGNRDDNKTEFRVEVDRQAPVIARVYREDEILKIVTTEDSTCRYSTQSCNFDFEDGIDMPYSNQTEHFAEWHTDQTYYIRCSDEYGNMPLSNQCNMIVRPYNLAEQSS